MKEQIARDKAERAARAQAEKLGTSGEQMSNQQQSSSTPPAAAAVKKEYDTCRLQVNRWVVSYYEAYMVLFSSTSP